MSRPPCPPCPPRRNPRLGAAAHRAHNAKRPQPFAPAGNALDSWTVMGILGLAAFDGDASQFNLKGGQACRYSALYASGGLGD